MDCKNRVVIGLVGTELDDCKSGSNWKKWRPSVSVCWHEELPVHRFELLCPASFERIAQTIASDIALISPATTVNITSIAFENPWDFEEVYGKLYDFVTKQFFGAANEEYLIHITTGTHVAQICLFLLAESRLLPGKLLQSIPPPKGASTMAGGFAIIDLDLSKYSRIVSRFEKVASNDISFLKSGIETKNSNFNRLIEMVEKVAINSKDPILLMGPTGAGKSQLAKRIFDLKKTRRQIDGDFIDVNCATLRGDTAMSALFGHVKGSFTGAASERPGLLKAADGGMLFLDEVGELGIDEQTMLLQAIETRRFRPFGSDSSVGSNFQLICGTNRDLIEESSKGKFREDLLARINLWTFRLPSIKERKEDIEPNILYELNRVSASMGKQVSFNKEAKEKFIVFALSDNAEWKANFRDLSSAITRMATMSSSGRITTDAVAMEIERLNTFWGSSKQSNYNFEMLRRAIDDEKLAEIDPFDMAQLDYTLKICKESKNLSDAYKKLFSVSRGLKTTRNDSDRLRKYLLKFGISWNDIKNIQVK